MTHVTCRLTAKNRDQLRNSTLGNRVWATFTFLRRCVCARAPSCSNNEITASHPDAPATSPCQIYGATPASIAVWDASTQTPAATPAELRADFTARCYACAVYAVSVTSRCSTKTDKHRLTQTTSHDSSGTLVFWCQTSPRNSTAISTLWT